MASRIEITGFFQFENKIKKVPERINRLGSAAVQNAAIKWSRLAKAAAPIDERRLANEIKHVKLAPMEAEVVVNANHAPWMEWGTKRRARIPSEQSQYAAQFRGKGSGTFADMVKALTAWVRRKGLAGRYSVKTRKRAGSKASKEAEDKAVAWPIIRSILKNGVRPHPFFFPQMPIVDKQFRSDLQDVMENFGK